MMRPSRTLMVAGALAWAGILAAMMTMSRETAPVEAKAAQFDSRWDDAAVEAAALKKQDRLAIEEPGPVAVKTESIVLVQPKAKVETKKAEPVERVERKRRGTGRDVCQRHGMHKVWIVRRHWKSWRCRR